MSCQELFKAMGFTCLEVADEWRLVQTPLIFPDGEPINLYLMDRGKSFRISDNADTLMHLRGVGIDMGDRKKWRGVRQIVSSYGIDLGENGEVFGTCAASGLQSLVSRYLSAMMAIGDLEREHMGISDEMTKFLDEVEWHLRAWRPKEDITRHPVVIGHSGRAHYFHFELGNDLIDAARPNSIRTGSILRKSADILNLTIKRKVMVVMDDREDPDRAKAETDILSNLVSVLPFTRLAQHLSGGGSPIKQ